MYPSYKEKNMVHYRKQLVGGSMRYIPMKLSGGRLVRVKHIRRNGKYGSGFMDVLKNVIKVIAPTAIDYGSNYLKKKVSGSGSMFRDKASNSILRSLSRR